MTVSRANEYDPRAVARYVGGGCFLIGIPARDMTMDEWYSIEESRRADALALGLYIIDAPQARETKRAAEAQENEE